MPKNTNRHWFDRPTSGGLTEMVRRELEEFEEFSMSEISRRTGIPYQWLINFRKGSIPCPNPNRMEYLYRFLTGKVKVEIKLSR